MENTETAGTECIIHFRHTKLLYLKYFPLNNVFISIGSTGGSLPSQSDGTGKVLSCSQFPTSANQALAARFFPPRLILGFAAAVEDEAETADGDVPALRPPFFEDDFVDDEGLPIDILTFDGVFFLAGAFFACAFFVCGFFAFDLLAWAFFGLGLKFRSSSLRSSSPL